MVSLPQYASSPGDTQGSHSAGTSSHGVPEMVSAASGSDPQPRILASQVVASNTYLPHSAVARLCTRARTLSSMSLRSGCASANARAATMRLATGSWGVKTLKATFPCLPHSNLFFSPALFSLCSSCPAYAFPFRLSIGLAILQNTKG